MKRSTRAAPLPFRLAALAWSGDGRMLAHASLPGHIAISERVDDGTVRERTALPIDRVVAALALSHSGEWLAAAGSGTLALWWNGLPDGQAVEVSRAVLPEAPADVSLHLAFTPDDKSLAVAQGAQLMLVRLDLIALRPKVVPSTLRIRKANDKRWDFLLVTPAGQLTERVEARPDLDAETVMDRLRPSLVVRDQERGTAAPADRLDAALAPIRRRMLPSGLGDSKAMEATDNAVALDVDPALAAYPWELLLTARGAAPLGPTHGLVRVRQEAFRHSLFPQLADAPMHALFISAAGVVPDWSSSTDDLDHVQAAAIAESLRASRTPTGLIDHRSRIAGPAAFSAIHERPWRLLALVGTPTSEGELALDNEMIFTANGLRQMQRIPDVVLMIGGDFRRQADAMRETGVAVCIASGWPIMTDSLKAFFSTFFSVLRSGQPLLRAVQAARQHDRAQGQGTAWALQVHGDPLWTWPELPVWHAPRQEQDASDAGGPSASALDAAPGLPAVRTLPAEVLQAVPGRDVIDVVDGALDHFVLSPETVREATTNPNAVKGASAWANATLTVLSSISVAPKAELRRLAKALDALVPARLLAPYATRAAWRAAPLTTLREGDRVLVLLHGLMADHRIAFPLSAAAQERLRDGFDGYVLAFDRPTLTWHPKAAAEDLLKRLPPGVRLHLLTHGSGALVAEAMARLLGGPSTVQRKAKPVPQVRRVALQRVVRVAGPVRGFGGRLRVDVPLSVQVHLLRQRLDTDGDKRATLLGELLLAVARDRDVALELPGLATMASDDNFIAWLNEPIAVGAPGDLRVISGAARASALGGALGLLSAGAFSGESDLLVPASSTQGGVPRSNGLVLYRQADPEVSHYDFFDHAATSQTIVDALLLDDPPGFAPIDAPHAASAMR